jgi:RNA polymerase sigma factor (sigma-70 family)
VVQTVNVPTMKPAAEPTLPPTRSFARSGGDTQDVSLVTQRLIENQDRFLRFLEKRVGNRQTAEEILQDAFVRVLARGGELRDGELVVAWFYRILRNAIVDHYRKKAVEQRVMDAVEAETAAQVEPDDALMEQSCACVVQLLDTLKSDHAEALRRLEIDGVSLATFAAEAGISPNNAGVRLHRARQALRAHLTAMCGSCAHEGCVDCAC